MRIYCYFSVFEPLFARVAEIFRDQYGVTEFGGFVWGQDQRRYLEARKFPWSRIDVFSDWLKTLPQVDPDLSRLERAEREYGLPNLALIVYADRFLAQRPYGEVMRILDVTFRNTERLFAEDRPDALIFESIDSIPTLILYSVAKKNAVPVALLDSGRIFGRIAMYEDHLQRYRHVDALFERLRERELTPTERLGAQNFLDDFRARRPRSPLLRAFEPAPTRKDVANFFGWARRYMLDRSNVTLSSPWNMVRQRGARLFRHGASSLLGYFQPPETRARYVLFPLHYQPETTTLVCAPFYVDQLALIEDIARSLPVGYQLYVKEHFASIGRRSLSDYRRLRKLWNVRLIGPYADGFGLMENAAAVATVTGTMGWEALLLERPVITFGEVFYNSCPLVARASQVPKSDWPALFRAVIGRSAGDRELLLTYVAAVLAGTRAESLVMDNPRTRPEVMQDDNVKKIATAFADALGLRPVG